LFVCLESGSDSHHESTLESRVFKTDSGHPKDRGVIVFTLATPENPLR